MSVSSPTPFMTTSTRSGSTPLLPPPAVAETRCCRRVRYPIIPLLSDFIVSFIVSAHLVVGVLRIAHIDYPLPAALHITFVCSLVVLAMAQLLGNSRQQDADVLRDEEDCQPLLGLAALAFDSDEKRIGLEKA
ncbi:hypothetical protein HMN09_01308600 [Mycena chlorophos]|uniref:Uncharacterized protein n=1 Tax=Mycena chlorophos TaxID=658473 RepID=A0A8H6S0Z4_MYCCL|nr:hypothetical protein HMN09_01308600 [Mycena chlorophos]